MDWLIALVSFVAGLALARLLQRSVRGPSARMVENVLGDKLRFAEQERDRAIRDLNANRIEMSTFGERFAALDERIATLEAELGRARAALAKAEQHGARQESELGALREVLLEARRTEALALIECRASVEEREDAFRLQAEAEDEARARRAEAAEARGRMEALTGDVRARAAELEVRSSELAKAHEAGARLGRELEGARGEVARLGRELSLLSVLPGELDQARRELLRREEALAALGSELEAARALIAELEPLPGELADLRAELERRDEARRGAEAELERAWRERHELVLQAKDADLGQARHEIVRSEQTLAALGSELEAARARNAELEALPGQLAAMREELERRDEARRGAEAELERAWRERHAAALQAKDADLAEERRRSDQRLERAHALELELERARDRVRELQAAGEAQSREGAELREERQRLSTELAAVKGATTKAEAGLIERAGRIAELEGTLRGKDLQLREVSRLTRDMEQSQARARKLEQELLRAQHDAEGLEAAAKAREKELAEQRREHARVEKELRATEAVRQKGVAALQESQARLRERDEELREKNARVKELEAERKSRPATLRPVPRPGPEHDDLKRIAGIGPALEKKLRRLGYRSCRQLAALDQGELEKLAAGLGLTIERIRREGWIASAKRLAHANGK